MKTQKSSHGEAEFLLRKLLLYGGNEVAHSYRWLSEAERWKELVFALLTRTTKLPQIAVRDLADRLHKLELLKISVLADLIEKDTLSPKLDDAYSSRIVELLLE